LNESYSMSAFEELQKILLNYCRFNVGNTSEKRCQMKLDSFIKPLVMSNVAELKVHFSDMQHFSSTMQFGGILIV
jgi:hypothetical protein